MHDSDRKPLAEDPRGSLGIARGLLLLGLVAGGAILYVLQPRFLGVPAGLIGLGGAALCAYALLVTLAWFPMPWLSRQLEAKFEDLIGEGVSAWYLAVALASFAVGEYHSLLAQWAAFESVEATLRQTIAERVVGFSVDSFMNLLWAALWPIKAVSEYGVWATAAFAAVIYAIVRLGQRVFGETRLGSVKAAAE